MGIFAIGEVVVLKFPFSDLTHKKYRPALVVARSDYGNIIVSQITSRILPGGVGLVLSNPDFVKNSPLKHSSYIRYTKLFTADPALVKKSLGVINAKKRAEVYAKIIEGFEGLK